MQCAGRVQRRTLRLTEFKGDVVICKERGRMMVRTRFNTSDQHHEGDLPHCLGRSEKSGLRPRLEGHELHR